MQRWDSFLLLFSSLLESAKICAICEFPNSFISRDLQHVAPGSLSRKQDAASLQCRGDKGEGAWRTNKANLEQPGGHPGTHCAKQTQFRQQKESPRKHRDPSPAFGRNQDLLSPKPALSEAEWDAKSTKKAKPYLCSSLGDLCVFARDIISFSTRTYASPSKRTGM
jgi:hypothetical protein